MLHPSAFGCFMLALISTILASPTQRRRAASNTEFYLQTCVINATDDYGTDKDGLYVSGYHTGAGLSDVALTPDPSIASKGFLNGTYLQFDYNSSILWYMDLGYEPYAGECSIDLHSLQLLKTTY
jgi:hypothetical protein